MSLSLEAAAAWALGITLGWITPQNAAEAELRPQIVKTAVDVVYDPWEPPLFPPAAEQAAGASHGREQTLLLLLAIVRYESDFRVSVDEGLVRGKAGDVCGMQIVVPRGTRILLTADLYKRITSKHAGWADAFTAEDLVPGSIPGRRENCLRAGLHMMRESMRVCRSLSLYARGDCKPDQNAKYRELLARETFKRHPPPVPPYGGIGTSRIEMQMETN